MRIGLVLPRARQQARVVWAQASLYGRPLNLPGPVAVRRRIEGVGREQRFERAVGRSAFDGVQLLGVPRVLSGRRMGGVALVGELANARDDVGLDQQRCMALIGDHQYFHREVAGLHGVDRLGT
jgi:hypothetical protein